MRQLVLVATRPRARSRGFPLSIAGTRSPPSGSRSTGATDVAIAQGQLAMTLDVQTAGGALEDTDVTLAILVGATTAVDPSMQLGGHLRRQRRDRWPGVSTLVVAPFGAVVELPLRGARFAVDVTADQVTGELGGVIDTEAVLAVFATWLPVATSIMERDCMATAAPAACTCTSGSVGDTLRYFDADHDCMVTLDEVTTTDLYRSLTAPDVAIDKRYGLSVGVGFVADAM